MLPKCVATNKDVLYLNINCSDLDHVSSSSVSCYLANGRELWQQPDPLSSVFAKRIWRGGRVWLIAHDSKSCRVRALVGSNPTLSVLSKSC